MKTFVAVVMLACLGAGPATKPATFVGTWREMVEELSTLRADYERLRKENDELKTTNTRLDRIIKALSIDTAKQEQPKRIAERPAKKPVLGGRHWIEDVSDDGAVVILEDGTIWRVDIVDQIDTMLWLPISDVLVRPSRVLGIYEMINLDDKEVVLVEYLGSK